MKIDGNVVLVTGGATGIGFALAEAFSKAGNTVIICGRREDRLMEAQSKLPGLQIKQCDLSKESERAGLHKWVSSELGGVNMLVNNAGIQRPINFMNGTDEIAATDDEIETNLKAPIDLTARFIPTLLKQKEAAIVNISSGLGFVPLAMFPIYCATKAAMHSYTMSLRHQLRNSPIRVFEVIPPIVDTELKGDRRRQGADAGIPAAEVAVAALAALEHNNYEIAIGMAERLRAGSRSNPDEAFKNMNSR